VDKKIKKKRKKERASPDLESGDPLGQLLILPGEIGVLFLVFGVLGAGIGLGELRLDLHYPLLVLGNQVSLLLQGPGISLLVGVPQQGQFLLVLSLEGLQKGVPPKRPPCRLDIVLSGLGAGPRNS